MRLTGRVQHHQQRWQQRDRCKESEDHPASSNLTKLRQTSVRSGHEGREADRSRSRSQGQRNAGFSCGASETSAQITVIVPFGAVTHAKLQPEINAEADEENKERH